ncbi:MAG: DNA-binding transcriptional regulator CytR [Armatimonadaceae bacterium]
MGVSEATVSRILSGRISRHNADTVARVQETARRLSYVPNTVARNLARRSTNLIGLAFESSPDFRHNYYFLEVFSGFLDVYRRVGYQVTILTSNQEDRNDIIHHLRSGQFDGALLIAPESRSPLLRWAQQSTYPIVSVGTTVPAEYGITCVDVDNVAGSQEAVRCLIAHGHTRIGFAGANPHNTTAALRYRGYEQAMQEAGLTPLPWLWAEEERMGQKSGAVAVLRLLDAHPDITAIYCTNDGVAIGGLQAATQTGRHVPEDLSVIGFDNAPEAELVQPALSTMRQDALEIGRIAAQQLLERIRHPEMEPQILLQPATLILRETVRAPHQSA